MSAAVELDTGLDVSTKPRLALLPDMPKRVSTFGFFVVIALIVAVGLAIVMATTTTVGAQSKELQRLRREAAELEYQTAALTNQLQTLSSPGSLAMRASDLGMVPNPYPAFLKLEDGSIVGKPAKVRGNEMTWLRIRSQASPETIPSAPVFHAPSSTLPLANNQSEANPAANDQAQNNPAANEQAQNNPAQNSPAQNSPAASNPAANNQTDQNRNNQNQANQGDTNQGENR